MGEEEIEAVSRVLRSGCLAQGSEVAAFEEECAAFAGRRYGVALNSGTAGLHLALLALGVGEGGRVAIPSYACAALAQSVTWLKARSVLCDSGTDFNLLPETVPSDCTAAIVPHLFGASAGLPAGVPVIEDIAQSFGGPAGRQGCVTVTSFYATKLCTTGEGGMLLTDDAALAEAARDRRDYDSRDDFHPRFAYKMTDFQAAMGRVQLRRLPGFIARRRAIAEAYSQAFSKLPMALPQGRDHVFFRYVLALEARDALERHLAACGVEAKRPVYRPAHLDFGGTFLGAARAHAQALSIPIYPALSDADTRCVIESVLSYFPGH